MDTISYTRKPGHRRLPRSDVSFLPAHAREDKPTNNFRQQVGLTKKNQPEEDKSNVP